MSGNFTILRQQDERGLWKRPRKSDTKFSLTVIKLKEQMQCL